MTDPNYTAVCLLIDRSGSMHQMREDAEGGINAFLDDQREATDRRTIRLASFDHDYTQVCPSIPAADVERFALMPRGSTALLDAMGRGIVEFGEEIAAMPENERPGNVVFAVMTDGYENASREWTLAKVKALVEQQQDVWKWTVVYLGANQDAIKEGAKYGVSAASSMTYDGAAVASATSALSGLVTNTSRGHAAGFTDQDRASSKRKS